MLACPASGAALRFAGLKVALIILHADPARGGAERYTVDLAAALAGRGHDVSVVCSDGETFERSPPFRQIGLQANALTRTGRYKRFLALVEQHTRAERHDIVHAMLPVHHGDLYHPHAGVAVAALDKW